MTALALTIAAQAQNSINLTKTNSAVVSLENRLKRIDTLVLQRNDVNIQSIPNANLLVNDSLIMLGTMDGAVFRIPDGSMVRRVNEQPFNLAQMTGEPAVHPGSALLDSKGQFCYAWGNAIVGGKRINFIKKIDFATGETLDSINVISADFSLSIGDSLRVATRHDYLTCFPEYQFTLPEKGRIARIRFFGGSKIWIKLYRKGRIEDYICNVDGTEVERVERLTCQGKDIDPNSVIGFTWDKLASVVGTDTEFIIYIYHLKS